MAEFLRPSNEPPGDTPTDSWPWQPLTWVCESRDMPHDMRVIDCAGPSTSTVLQGEQP
jgi:hypothetical protein